MNFTDKQLMALATDEKFQAMIDADPVLADLSQPETDRARELDCLMDMFGSLSSIGCVSVQPITPALWSFLWITGNRFVTDREKITAADVDQFLYLLRHGVRDPGCSIEELPAKASGCVTKSGLTIEEAAGGILQLIHTAFHPLAMLPACPETSDQTEIDFGAAWLAVLVSAVSSQVHLDPATILFNTPLSVCFGYYINYLKGKGVEGIRKRSGAERVKAIMDRTEQLMAQYIQDKGL